MFSQVLEAELLIDMFFDAHSHTQFAAFAEDCEEVIERAIAAGVWMIIVGTQKDTSRRAIELAQKYPEGVYASVGLHPIQTERLFHDAKELDFPALSTTVEQQESQVFSVKTFRSRGEEFDYNYYRQLAQSTKVLTIGECGLDYFRVNEQTKHKQAETFEQQIQLARDVEKPLMIHCREAFDDLIQILRGNSPLLLPNSPGIVHFFTGTKENAKALVDLGFSFTFGGLITLVGDFDETIRMLPLESILSETDAPYFTPHPHGRRRNEPAFVIDVVQRLAEIRNVSFEQMKESIWGNVKRFFGTRL